jgi:basic amino acid/polyamine antiporter, APA family
MPQTQTAITTESKNKIGFLPATTIVIANMVGTGVFTSLGFQAAGIDEPLTLLLLWVIGGFIALCGAFSYAELGSAMPRSGGEYHYLSRLYHPSVGFLSGWFSATVGFSAPMALAAMAFGHYFFGVVPALSPQLLGTIVIVCVALIHLTELRISGRFQSAITLFEIGLIVLFIFCGVFITPAPITLHLMPTAKNLSLLFCPAFAVSLVYVSYAYSGWNGATYLASEIKDASSNLPKSLLTGTGIVIVLYVLLNFVFLHSTPLPDLSGKLEVGLLSAVKIFDGVGGKIMGLCISLCLVSSISSMVMAGPRILKVMGEDYPRLALFSKENARGVPWVAICTQTGLALILLWTSTFEKVLMFTGFTMALFTSISVIGVFVLRGKKNIGTYTYKTTGFPVTPVIFLALNGWMIIYLLKERPVESFAGLGILLAGIIVYYFIKRRPQNE